MRIPRDIYLRCIRVMLVERDQHEENEFMRENKLSSLQSQLNPIKAETEEEDRID